jgi:hypothetical protein
MSYISRDGILNDLQEALEVDSIYYNDDVNKGITEGLNMAIKHIKRFPTADVVEVKHGKSISKLHYSDEFICSECGLIMRECCRYEIDEDADGDESCYGFEFKYCPNCGAKMDGERREG